MIDIFKIKGVIIAMSRKCIEGKCRICGEYKRLTYEHVPPEIAFNKKSVKVVKGDTFFTSQAPENRLPWELNNLRMKILQKGKGGYYLCSECNSKTGSWYVPYYSEFVSGIHYALAQIGDQKFNSLHIKMNSIRPLAIFKQIITMFCDINQECLGDKSLGKFILDKDSTVYDKQKFRVFAYINDGQMERMNGITANLVMGVGVVVVTEISSYPIGLALYINLPNNYSPQGTEITSFADMGYNDTCDVEIVLPKLENNTWFSGDYRTREEVINCRNENRKLDN